MTIGEIREILHGKLLAGEDMLGEEVLCACGADLMSDALAFAHEKAVLITGLINPQVMITAEMLDAVCIVFSRGKQPSEEMLTLAREAGLAVISTPMTTYTSCGELYLRHLPGSRQAD
ncbi:MAG: DRTGG domain-containing protein [Clostridia bacterium]|nr:DRTGG domain-containing protein [Clostridia bacterium]